MKRNWILVANQAEAQIFCSDRLPGALSLVKVLSNKEGTARSRDLVSDAPGRAFDSQGLGRHAMEPKTGVKEEQRRKFVKEMVEQLQTGRVRGDFNQLVLMAAPAVLGVIRKTLNPELERAVIKEVPKDLIGQGVDNIQSQLARAFALR